LLVIVCWTRKTDPKVPLPINFSFCNCKSENIASVVRKYSLSTFRVRFDPSEEEEPFVRALKEEEEEWVPSLEEAVGAEKMDTRRSLSMRSPPPALCCRRLDSD
jgi:hypothetical protein